MTIHKYTSHAKASHSHTPQPKLVSKSACLLLLGCCLAATAADIFCYSRPGRVCRPANNGDLPCDMSDVYPPYGVCKKECPTTPGYSYSACEGGTAVDKCSQATLVMTVNHERRACTAPMVCGPGTWVTWWTMTVTNTFSWDPGYVYCGG
jgi:hypothetical protein